MRKELVMEEFKVDGPDGVGIYLNRECPESYPAQLATFSVNDYGRAQAFTTSYLHSRKTS